jgi:drug/metabolite transporter (DMT)-like permease
MASPAAPGLAPGRAGIAPSDAPAPGPSDDGAAARPGVWLTNVLLLVMALIWGVNFSVLKLGTAHLAPVAFNGLRLLLAASVLGAIAVVARRGRMPARRDVVRLALLGVLGHGLYQFLFILGIARSTAGTAALVMAAGPAFTGVVGRLLGVERPSGRAWAGIAFQLTGMAGVVFGSATRAAQSDDATPLGPVFILAAALTWAFYAVLLKPFAERVDPIQLSAWTLLGGVVTLGGLALPDLVRLDYAALPPVAWFAVFYSGLLAMVVAYLFYYRGVRVVGPVRTAMFSNLQPIVALVVAYLTLGERPGPWQLFGATLIAAGLLVSRRRSSR